MNSLGNERGSSLLEVSIVLFFLGFACIPLINLFHASEVSALTTRQEIIALNQAQEIVEQVKALPDVFFGVVQDVAEGSVLLENRVVACCDQGLLVLTGGPGSGQVRGIAEWEESNVLLDYPLNNPLVPGETSYLVLPLSEHTYPFTIGIISGEEPGLRTVTVTVSYQEKGIIKEVVLVTEKLRR